MGKNSWYLGGDDSVVGKALRDVVAVLGEAVRYINGPGVALMGRVNALREGTVEEEREKGEEGKRDKKQNKMFLLAGQRGCNR